MGKTKELVESYYTEYSSYVVEGRALPSIIDGLKKVERRMLYVLLNYPDKFNKSAVISGDTMKLHPHGDSYGTLIKFANSQIPLVDTQGNFGSREFGAAASRYTGAKLSRFSRLNHPFYEFSDMVEGEIEGYKEPSNLPTLIPYAIIAGSEGLGSGISSCIPSLNIADVADSYIEYIKTGEIKKLPKLEFNKVVILSTKDNTDQLLISGKGSVSMRGVVEFDKENPYAVNLMYRPDKRSMSAINASLHNRVEYVNLDIMHQYVIMKGTKGYGKEELQKFLEKKSRVTVSYDFKFHKKDVAVIGNYKEMVKESYEYLKDCYIRYYKSKVKEEKFKLDYNKMIKFISTSDLLPVLSTTTESDFFDYCRKNHPIKEFESDEYIDSIITKCWNTSIKNYSKGISDELLESINKTLSELIVKLDSPESGIIELYKNMKSYVRSNYENLSIYEGVVK